MRRPRPERPPLPASLTVASGFLMGFADAIPGISGGTIALVLGLYERLIDALAVVLRVFSGILSSRGRRRILSALGFLVPLGAGILPAYWVVTRVLVGPSESPGILLRPQTAPYCYAFFFGLVLLSAREPWRRLTVRTARVWLAAAAGAALAAWMTGLQQATEPPEPWMLIYGGALAISVMLLPGVSGSLCLVLLGQYAAVTGAVHDLDLLRLGLFLLGILLGLSAVVPLLRLLLNRHHDLTMAALTGLMVGSLRAVWPWKANYDLRIGPLVNVSPAEPGIVAVLPAAIVGAAAVLLLARLERRILRAESERGARSPPAPGLGIGSAP